MSFLCDNSHENGRRDFILIKPKEREILRRLVSKYMEIATLPVQKEKIKLWKAVNSGKMIRPMVVMDQLPWNELVCEDLTSVIEDPYWRTVENNLRMMIYKWEHFPVDMVLDPFIPIYKSVGISGYGLSASAEIIGDDDSTAKSYHYKNCLKSMEDVEKIVDRRVTHDVKATELHEQEAKELFGDLAPALSMGLGFHIGIWDFITELMSIDDAYLAFIDEPELLHAAMGRLTESLLCAIKDANDLGVHADNANTCHCSYIYTDGLLPDSGQGKGPFSKNSWSFGLAQLFTGVSPDLFAEFEVPYASKLAEQFGMVYYGCCDRLDDRLDHVKKIPNVKKVSCSPWSNRENFAANIGTELVMSVKPNPAFVAVESFDKDIIKNDLMSYCELSKQNGVNLEFILKDISTVLRQPDRLTKWADIAMEVVQNY